jgi:O-antigen/teichoic acid export membrane protein
VLALKAVLRLEPFSVSTEEGRSLERYRRAVLTSFTSLALRGVTTLCTLITVRLTLGYLGTERYGLWMTITSVSSMLSFADLGIGNGLLTVISQAHGREDRASARKYVSSGFFVLFGVAVILTGLFALVYPFVPWPRVFNVTSLPAAQEAGPAMVVFLACFALNLPFDVVQRVQAGYQEGFQSNLWAAGGSVTALGALLVAMKFKAGLPWLVLALTGGQLLGLLCNWGYEFARTRPWLLPRWANWDVTAARKILGTGAMFFVLQVSSVFTVAVDNIIIAQILGPEAVTQYAVPMRMFLLVLFSAVTLVIPLWPAYGEAAARGDREWVKSTVYHSLGYNLAIFGPLALGLAAFGKMIVHVWVGNQVHPTFPLLFGMATWTILAVFGNTAGMFFFGINELRLQVVTSVLMAIANLGLKIVLGKWYGIVGVVWTPVFTGLPVAMLFAWYIHRLLTRPATLGKDFAS